MPQFDTSTFLPQIFWLIVCFGILLTLMAWLLVPRLAKAIEVRENRLQEDLARAKSLLEEVEALRKEAHERLHDVRHTARERYHQALEAIQHEKAIQLHNVNEQSSKNLSRYFKKRLEERSEFNKGLADTIVHAITTLGPTLLVAKPSAQALHPIVEEVLKDREA